MSSEGNFEKLVAQKATYSLYKDGQIYIIENVPARVDLEAGEQYFSPKAVEHIHQIILGQGKPVRTIQTPVFNYA